MFEFELWEVVVWLISNAVVAGLLASCAFFTDRIMKRPALSHLLWMLVLIKLITPPLLVLPISVDASRLAWISTAVANDQQPLTRTSTAAIADSMDHARLTEIRRAIGVQRPQPTWWLASPAGLLVYVWIAGAAALVVRIVVAARQMKALIDRRGRFDLSATRQVAALASPNGTETPPVWLVDAVLSPMLLGTGRHVRIIFPKALWYDLQHDARAALLLHELEHWRRRDTLVRYLEVVAGVVLWWHPLVWIARRQIEVCEERCCDMAASNGSAGSPRVYAEAILATLDFLSEGINWNSLDVGPRPLASGVGRLPRMEQRLRQIMQPPTAVRQEAPKWLLLMAVALVLPLFPSIVLRRTVDANDSGIVHVQPIPSRHK